VREYLGWSRRAREETTEYAPPVTAPVYQLRAVPAVAMAEEPTAVQGSISARRRRVITVMVGAVAAPALVALATGSNIAWWVLLGMLPVVLVYLGVLYHARRQRAEREFNVAFFGKTRRGAAGLEEVFPGSQDTEWVPGQWDGIGAAGAGSAP
jgi:Flp pilus assembly protein TadB